MRTDFNLSNLLGTVYHRGTLLFSPDGNSLLSPVGNRVTVFDLVNDKSSTLPFAHRRDITHTALSGRGNLLLSIDQDGKAILTHLPSRLVVYQVSFRGPPSALAFSPCGHFFAVATDHLIETWQIPKVPSATDAEGLEFAPFVRERSYAGHSGTVCSINWSDDSQFFVSSGSDLSVRIWSLKPTETFTPVDLTGHRKTVVGAWFSSDKNNIYSISEDGALFVWASPALEDGQNDSSPWRIIDRHYFNQHHANLNCADFHADAKLMVAGFSNGLFCLIELPNLNVIHTLSISRSNIGSVAINQSAEWLAFGSSSQGQLMVWEWQSESYVLKQQGHFDSINDISYSPDGTRIATAADDGKVKLWDAESGFCIVTFTEHQSSVTACEFARRAHILFTASLDGSIRAWDLIRYRNFRTFSAPDRLPFSSVAVDPSTEIVCAGSMDSFEIHIWAVQTGQLLDRLSGHESPVISLGFAPPGNLLVSGSWDHSVRLWDIFNRSQTSETMLLQADILSLAFRPDANQIAVSTIDGQITFWSPTKAVQEGSIDGRRDISGGRKSSDHTAAATSAGTKHFTTIVYSGDSSCLAAAGNSKFLCLYDVQTGMLLRKIAVSVNLSLDGTQEFLNNKSWPEASAFESVSASANVKQAYGEINRTSPSVIQKDSTLRQTKPVVRLTALAFAPTGQTLCAASTEGLLMYSTGSRPTFDPFDLGTDTTPSATLQAVREGDYLLALVLAFRLNDAALIKQVFVVTPVNEVDFIVGKLPHVYLGRLMISLSRFRDATPYLELCLRWIEAIVVIHGRYLKERHIDFSTELRALQKVIDQVQIGLSSVSNDNMYAIEYLSSR